MKKGGRKGIGMSGMNAIKKLIKTINNLKTKNRIIIVKHRHRHHDNGQGNFDRTKKVEVEVCSNLRIADIFFRLTVIRAFRKKFLMHF